MAVVVAGEHADRAIRLLDDAGERAHRIGEIVAPEYPNTVPTVPEKEHG